MFLPLHLPRLPVLELSTKFREIVITFGEGPYWIENIAKSRCQLSPVRLGVLELGPLVQPLLLRLLRLRHLLLGALGHDQVIFLPFHSLPQPKLRVKVLPLVQILRGFCQIKQMKENSFYTNLELIHMYPEQSKAPLEEELSESCGQISQLKQRPS